MLRGRMATSALSDCSEMDIDGSESELAKLQRQFRIMEGDHQAYSTQAREQIRKHQKEIEMLLKEQEELYRDLGACKSVFRQQQDIEDTQSLRALLKQRDMLDEDLRTDKKSQQEIKEEIAKVEMKLSEMKRGKVSTSETQRAEAKRTQKAIHTLEYKLDRSSIRFNEQLTKNNQLREELQILHIERNRFQQVRNRLEKELCDVRKKIGEVISLSTAAYDARLEAQSKTTMMKEKAVKDLAQYNTEMKDLERAIAHEFSLKEFMSTKCSEREDVNHDLELRQLTELKEQKRMESYEALKEVFHRIQSVTGEDNLDMLLTTFIQVDDQNFSLFNFVNEQNNEAEALRDQISRTQADIEQFRVADLQQEQDHRWLLRDIDEQRRETESLAEDYENQASIMSEILDQIKTGVNSIVSKMECDCSVIEDALGSSSGISENNIMSYLGLVEQKTNELLTIQAFLNFKIMENEYNPGDLAKFLLGQNPELLQQNVSGPPTINSVEYDEEESPVNDEEERPFSQKELRMKIMKGKSPSEDKKETAEKSTKLKKTDMK